MLLVIPPQFLNNIPNSCELNNAEPAKPAKKTRKRKGSAAAESNSPALPFGQGGSVEPAPTGKGKGRGKKKNAELPPIHTAVCAFDYILSSRQNITSWITLLLFKCI